MASVLEGRPPAQRAEERFFLVMACIISAIIVVGFAVHLALGRSTFAVPAVYHLHAFVFFGWVALYLAQNWLIAANNVRLHRTLGLLAYGWAPVMVVMGFAIMIASLQRSGGPFFFDQNEFLFSNTLLLVLFGAVVFIALRRRRYSGWHRRLMLVACLSGVLLPVVLSADEAAGPAADFSLPSRGGQRVSLSALRGLVW